MNKGQKQQASPNLYTFSLDDDGQHNSGDHRVHAAEEDLQAACSLPPVSSLQVGGTADRG